MVAFRLCARENGRTVASTKLVANVEILVLVAWNDSQTPGLTTPGDLGWAAGIHEDPSILVPRFFGPRPRR